MLVVGGAAAGYQFRHIIVGFVVALRIVALRIIALRIIDWLLRIIRFTMLEDAPADGIHRFDDLERGGTPEEERIGFCIVPDEIHARNHGGHLEEITLGTNHLLDNCGGSHQTNTANGRGGAWRW